MNFRVEVKKNKDGFLEMHPSEAAVIVKYRVEAVVVRPDGTIVARGNKVASKLMHFTNLADATDLKRVARDAISKCSYLDPARIDELEQILAAIRTRQKLVQPSRPGTGMRPATARRTTKTEAKISDLQQYRQLLYNSIEEKVLGSEMILQLAQSNVHVAQVARSDPVINALARLLFEDESRNLDLKINICRIFACMTQLSLAPALFAKNRIGGSLLQEIGLEHQRYQKWKEQLALHQNDPTELEGFRKKFVQFLRKEDQFITVALQILLVLGRDLSTQTKMVKKEIILILSKCCERSNADVQVLSLRFLLRLSLFVENLERFVQAATVEKVARAVDQQRNKEVCQYGLNLLYNLSLCPALRKSMLKKGVSRRILPLLEDPKYSELAAKLLYSMSQDNKSWKDDFLPELSSTCARLLVEQLEKQLKSGPYLMALTTNLVNNATVADEFASATKIPEVMTTALKSEDMRLLKIINLVARNASDANWVTQENTAVIVKIFTGEVVTEFGLECLMGIAIALDRGYCTMDDLSRLCKLGAELSAKCRQLRKPAELLTLVFLLGSIASLEKGANILTTASISDWLCQILGEVEEDQEEIALQVGFALLKLTQYEPARLRIMDYPGITKVLSDHAQQSSEITKSLFEELLSHLSMVSEEIHEAWKTERFQQYNGQWLQAIATRRGDGIDNVYAQEDFNDDELDLVTRFGLDELSDEMDEDEDDVEDMIERYSARSHSRLDFRD